MAANNPLAADELSADEEKLLREAPDDAPIIEDEKPVEPEIERASNDGAANSEVSKEGRGDGGVGGADSSSLNGGGSEPQRTVPLASLIEERKDRQRLEKELAEYKGRTEATIRAIQDRLKPKEEEPKAPTLETDPVGVLRETQAQVAALKQRQEAEAQLNQFSGYVANQVQAFRSNTPDYDAALQHARTARLSELKIMGMGEEQARQQLALDEFAFAQQAIQNQRNVGQALYEYAGLKGYKKPEAAPAQAATPTPEQKLETIVKGQQAAKSLGGASGAVGAAPLTIEKLIEMTPEQIGSLDEEQFRRLMGG